VRLGAAVAVVAVCLRLKDTGSITALELAIQRWTLKNRLGNVHWTLQFVAVPGFARWQFIRNNASQSWCYRHNTCRHTICQCFKQPIQLPLKLPARMSSRVAVKAQIVQVQPVRFPASMQQCSDGHRVPKPATIARRLLGHSDTTRLTQIAGHSSTCPFWNVRCRQGFF
jgi:hypothetical protein